ncbi:hypothetical protein [Thermococcus sp. MV5]|uniref:OsmC family protein n=1 Tax=Thermococcus sp. MV5 TaxID=1638272 RepID=UPI001F0D2E65|nr:hypothetical protein [Thermococcus sp. MV5]
MGGRAGYKEIRVEILPEGNVEETKLAEWIREVEERCPITNNLKNPAPVKIEIRKENL